MTPQEWESLCDGCARCCLLKLEYADTKEMDYTGIVCRYYDEKTATCSCYTERSVKVPTCVHLDPDNIRTVYFMPKTCAYRLIAEGKDLPWWHHLVSGSRETVHRAGVSIRGKVLHEDYVHPDDWERHIINWVT